jgi:hypothetical protein
MRYIVTGRSGGVPVGTRYKQLGTAKKFADTLTDSEVYDSLTNTYVYGSSKFIKMLEETLNESQKTA